jgi:predicted metalloprotease with PDZ domain
MRRFIVAGLVPILLASAVSAQRLPDIQYTLRVDSAVPQILNVDMRVRGAGDTFTIAAAAHPEYDDKYWRYIENMRSSVGAVVRMDSVRWRVTGAAGGVDISYAIRIPATERPRASWRAHIDGSGGLIGGPHSFLYIIGAENAAPRVTLDMPRSWRASTALAPKDKKDPRVFTAPDMHALMESPILVGTLREWRFTAGGVPHRIVYAMQPDATPFDTIAFVNGVKNLVTQTVGFFGGTPYREYTFLFRDDSWSGGLEHPNSVSLGAPSAELAKDPTGHLREIAHEFFHTWNLMSIKPIEYRGVDYRVQPPVSGLWFSEGLTIFYADLLLRRAGGAGVPNTRPEHVGSLLQYYLSTPGNLRFSAEHVSRLAYNAGPEALGDYDASTHAQGEVIGTMLDIIVRDATNGARSMDDVMRLLYKRFPATRGFEGADIERGVGEVCGCSVKPFFDAHVRGAGAIDYNRYLALVGLNARVTTVPVVGADGQPAPDRRLRAWEPRDSAPIRLLIWDPSSVWARAGLHTGDVLVSVNSAPVRTWMELRSVVGAAKIGDTMRFVVQRNGRNHDVMVGVTGYSRPNVVIEEVREVTEKVRSLRAQWLSGSGH